MDNFIIKVEALLLVKWSYRSPSTMLDVKVKMVNKFQTCCSISFKHMPF